MTAYSEVEWHRYEVRRKAWSEWCAVNPYHYTVTLIDLLLRGNPPRKYLDTACGSGEMLAAADAVWPDATVVGLDGSLTALAKAEIKAPKASLVMQDLDDISLYGKDFDLITALFCLYHATDPHATFSSLVEHLAPDGLLIASTISIKSMPELWQHLSAASEPTGLEQWQLGDLAYHHSGVSLVSLTTVDALVRFPTTEDVQDFVASTLTRSSYARYVDDDTPKEVMAKFAFAAYRKVTQ